VPSLLLPLMLACCLAATAVLLLCAGGAQWTIEADSEASKMSLWPETAAQADANRLMRSTISSSPLIRDGIASDDRAGAGTSWVLADTNGTALTQDHAAHRDAQKIWQSDFAMESERYEADPPAEDAEEKEKLDLVTTTEQIDQLNAEGNCTWKEADKQLYVKKVFPVSIMAICLSIALVVAISLPLCCGIGKSHLIEDITHDNEKAVQFAAAVGFLGVLAALIPLIGSKWACKGLDKKICGACLAQGKSCSPQELTTLASHCGSIGTGAAYGAAYGKVAVIFGIVALILSGLACGGQCKLKGPEKFDMMAPVGAAAADL